MFNKVKLDKQTRDELRLAKKEQKRCEKLYSDWKNDEYNCGPLKYIWGIQSSDDLSKSTTANFNTLNDLDIYYNRDTKKYLIGLETIYLFKTTEATICYLNKLLEQFNNYLKKDCLFDCKFNPFFLYTYNNGEFFQADSLTELYYKFKIFVTGYSSL